MIVALPVSHLITPETLEMASGVEALEYRDALSVWPDARRRYLHSGLGIVQDAFMDEAARTADAINGAAFDWFSFDCGPAARRPRVEGFRYVCDDPPLARGALASLICERAERLRSFLDAPLAVENLNYYATPAYEHVCEPDFISEIVRRCGFGLVLDIAHAIVSAGNLGVDLDAYLDALPLDCVCGVHLSGAGRRDGIWRDLHAAPGEREYAVLERLAPRMPADAYVAIEHYESMKAVVDAYAALSRFLERKGGYGRETGSVAV